MPYASNVLLLVSNATGILFTLFSRYIADITHKGNFLIGIGNHKLATMYFDKALAINPKNIAAITGKKQAIAALNQAK